MSASSVWILTSGPDFGPDALEAMTETISRHNRSCSERLVKSGVTMSAYIAGMTLASVQERNMGEVVQFVSKADLERARLIREAREIYESIFPAEAVAGAEKTVPPAKS